MKKRSKMSFFLILVFVLILSACSSGTKSTDGGSSGNTDTKSNTDEKTTKQEEVVISFPSYKTGTNVGAKFFVPQVKRFNEKYDGKYQIELQKIPQKDYQNKIKLLAQQGKLPPLIEGGTKEFMENVVIKKDLYYDLKPWLNKHPELKKRLIDKSIKFNTTDDGKLVSMPLAVIRPIGLYYNKDMFKDAGITKPISQMTFDEFDKALKKLKEAGHTPLTLMTGENAWTTMLLASAFLANQPGGTEVLNSTKFVYDYTDPMWVKTFAEIQKWFQNYTTDNAIGAAYADAANNFLNKRTAIIANGPWMTAAFSDTSKAPKGFEKKVGASIYPGGVALGSATGYYYWIPKKLSDEKTEAALAFLEFINSPEELEAYMVAEGGYAPNIKTSDDFLSEFGPILGDLKKDVKQNMNEFTQSLGKIWPPQIVNSEFGRNLPLLANGSMTPEEFAKQLTQKAQKFK